MKLVLLAVRHTHSVLDPSIKERGSQGIVAKTGRASLILFPNKGLQSVPLLAVPNLTVRVPSLPDALRQQCYSLIRAADISRKWREHIGELSSFLKPLGTCALV